MNSGHLSIRKDVDCPKVRVFLESKARNSTQTARAYAQALANFRLFVDRRFSGKYDIETITDAMTKKEVDVYKILDEFIGFLQNIPEDISQKRMQLDHMKHLPK